MGDTSSIILDRLRKLFRECPLEDEETSSKGDSEMTLS